MAQKIKKYGNWTEDDMSRAISAYDNGDMGLNAVCRTYGIPKPTLKRHMQGTNVYANYNSKKLGRSQELPKELEDQLYQHVLRLEKMFFGLGRDDLKRLAFQIAEENNLPHRFNRTKKTAGNKWYYSFLKRYPQLSLRKPEATSIARATGFSKDRVNEFFEKLTQVVDENKFQASDIYNVDETALSTVQKPKKVVGLKGKRQIGAMTSGERGVLTTGIFAMSASGFFLPPLLVFKGQRFKPEWKHGAPPGTEFAMSDNGWSNNEVFYKWMQHFVKFTKPSVEKKVLLILDGHASHTKDLKTIDYAKENGVVMISLPSHTSHKLQPLDHSFFAPLKSNFNKAADRYIRTNQTKITVSQIAQLLGESFPTTAVAATAMNGFSGCGIWPINVDKFTDDDFAVSPLALDPDTNESSTLGRENRQVTHVAEEPSCSGSGCGPQPKQVFKTVEEISPVPNKTKGLKRKALTVPCVQILTGTPYKKELEMKKQKKEEVEKKRQIKQSNAKKKINFGDIQRVQNKKMKKSDTLKEDWYCNICEASKEEAMIQCIKCEAWCHQVCAGVKPKQKSYFCPSCN